MKTLCFYISDYGYGHASRSIALIREIVRTRSDVTVIAKTSGPYEFTRKSLIHPRVSVIQCRNDCEVELKEGLSVVDREKTRELFLAWVHTWDEYLSRECAFCREHKVDLILSDIAPQPFLVAEALGIPGIAVSNFSWDTIFEHLFPEVDEVSRLRDAYRKASYACVLPFDIGMDRFAVQERVGLVSRNITVSRSEMRHRLGVPENDFLVFVGKSPDTPLLSGDPGIRFLVSSGNSCPDVLVIPAEETESQDWIGMCDCVVTKCGYSTVSEAVRAHVPVLVWKREGFIEDSAISAKIETLGIGKMVSGAADGVDYCLTDRSSIERFRHRYETIDPLYHENGIYAILRVIQRMIG
jgi:hypothetical protein